MKFKIRFADQIVGFSIIFSIVALVAVVVLLGQSQRWFAKDASFLTFLPSATGLSRNMAVQYKGFTIGNVKDFHLNEHDDVEVVFIIHEEYRDRVRMGSVVELSSSPIGLGSSFQFHFGKGDELAEGSLIPPVGSAQARELMRLGLTVESPQDDSISTILSRVNFVLWEVDQLLAGIIEAVGPGTDATELGKMIGSIQKTLSGVEEIPQNVDSVIKSVDDLLAQLSPTLDNIAGITGELNDPDGLLHTALDTDGEVYINLVKSLTSVSSILASLDETVAFIPSQIPQLSGLIIEVRSTLSTVEDVLVGLTNNPLIRGGIPQRPESQGSIGPRELRF